MRLAARGRREDESGNESNTDDKAFDEAARRQARSVTIKSAIAMIVFTAIAFAIPPLR